MFYDNQNIKIQRRLERTYVNIKKCTIYYFVHSQLYVYAKCSIMKIKFIFLSHEDVWSCTGVLISLSPTYFPMYFV